VDTPESEEVWPPAEALFDPWGATESPAPDSSSSDAQEGAASGPPEFPPHLELLRRELIPWLEALRERLAAGGHRGTIQDLTDVPWSPAVRMLVWPRSGLMEEAGEAATVEVVVRFGDDGSDRTVEVRHLRDSATPSVVAMRPVPLATWEWLHEGVSAALGEILRDR